MASWVVLLVRGRLLRDSVVFRGCFCCGIIGLLLKRSLLVEVVLSVVEEEPNIDSVSVGAAVLLSKRFMMLIQHKPV